MSTYLTIQEAKDLLRVSERTVRRWISKGELPAFKMGRSVRIREEDIQNHGQVSPQARKNRETQLEVLEKARQLRAKIQEQHGTPANNATDILRDIRLERSHAQ